MRQGPEPGKAWQEVSLRLVPAVKARPPASYITAIGLIVSAESSTERRLLIENDEQMCPESNGRDRRDCSRTGIAEDDPQPDPASGEAHVHGVAHVAIKAHHY